MVHRFTGRPKGTTFENIGVCPRCGKVDGYYNYGPNHWFVCFEHKVQWLGAYDLFSTWRNETTDDWINNRLIFEVYKAVTPTTDRKSGQGGVYNYIKLAPDTEWQ